ncbi:hypothetical protein V8C86DRAFT_2469833 [Haematococcus lacustris]
MDFGVVPDMLLLDNGGADSLDLAGLLATFDSVPQVPLDCLAPLKEEIDAGTAAPSILLPPIAPPPLIVTTSSNARTNVSGADAHTDMDAQDEGDEEEDATEEAGGQCQSKRRRRIRNAKQQELNRLAQQRYRMRKKQRQQDLQVTVDTLATQLSQLKMLENEIEVLKKDKRQLQIQLHAQTATLQQSVAHGKAQEAVITQLSHTNAELQLRLSQQQQAVAANTSASPGSLAALSPSVLSEQLVAVLQTALAEVGLLDQIQAASNSSGAGTGNMLHEALLRAIQQQVQRACWRDVAVSQHQAVRAGAAPSLLVGQASGTSLAAITVSCC